MRRVIVQELVTVDGFVAGPDGELDFFDAVEDYSEVNRDNLRILEEDVDLVLLGAATYRMFVEYWPTADHELMGHAVNTVQKTVFSSTLSEAPWGEWAPAEVVNADAVAVVTDLKQQEGKDIMVWGSLSLVRSLIGAGLVDELQLRVCPVALGSGTRLFAGGGEPLGLELAEAKPYQSGIVTLRYRPSTTSEGNGG